jgi:hypothetical protein
MSASLAPTRGKAASIWCRHRGYKGEVPEGYHVVRTATYGTWLAFRSFLADGSTKPGVESVKKNLKIYQLADAANPCQQRM